MNQSEMKNEVETQSTHQETHVQGPHCQHGHSHPLKPFVRQQEKIGRNDPCPCGSQKKYKKCHGQN